MASQQQDNTFEIKVPIFCEWTFEKGLPDASGNPRSLYKYAHDVVAASEIDYLVPCKHSLPGFPGIKYGFNIVIENEMYLLLEFEIRNKYDEYIFDADFTCTVTDLELQQFNYKFDNVKKYRDTSQSTFLHQCLDECNACPLCAPNKKLVFRAEGTFTVKYVKAFKYFPFKDSEKVCELRNEKIDTKDFVIIAEEKEIRVHKAILAESSTVFARMLEFDNWKETMENKIIIPGFSYKVIKAAVNGCYSKLYNNLKMKEEYMMAFQFADKYDMQKLASAIKEVIDFTPFNVVEYANYFFQNNAAELVDCCIDYIFSCSQYSISIKNIELMDTQIRAMSFDRMLVSPVLKKDPKLEHRRYNYEGQFDDDDDE